MSEEANFVHRVMKVRKSNMTNPVRIFKINPTDFLQEKGRTPMLIGTICLSLVTSYLAFEFLKKDTTPKALLKKQMIVCVHTATII